ncbi:MAG: hypothetical protein ACW99A_22910 [Candidatus Kariarchaeaceae archaeon]|jgi:aspartate carbamoyltransferase catalytic subunit
MDFRKNSNASYNPDTRGFIMRSFLGRDILTLEDIERNEIFHILSVAQELEPIARERRNTDILTNICIFYDMY